MDPCPPTKDGFIIMGPCKTSLSVPIPDNHCLQLFKELDTGAHGRAATFSGHCRWSSLRPGPLSIQLLSNHLLSVGNRVEFYCWRSCSFCLSVSILFIFIFIAFCWFLLLRDIELLAQGMLRPSLNVCWNNALFIVNYHWFKHILFQIPQQLQNYIKSSQDVHKN